MTQLSTERLQLRPLTPADEQCFHATNVSESVKAFLWDNETIPVDTTRELLRTSAAHFDRDGWGLWKLLTRGEQRYIGYAGLWYFFDEPQPQLLYALDPAFTGQGFATEAARAVIDYAFRDLHFTYLRAAIDVGNDASVGVCERLGFALEAQRDQDGKPTLFYRLEHPLAAPAP